jgi:hypothetical protein
MLQILAHTPIWVFVLFVVLLVFGLLQTRSRAVKPLLAYFLPAGMIALSLAGVQSSFGIQALPVGSWATGVAMVTFIGVRFFPLKAVTYDSEKKHFLIPGGWLPFFVIMAIFFTKYAVAVMRGLDSPFVDRPAFAMALSLAYGCFSGYFAARAVSLVAAARQPDNPFVPTPRSGAA